VLAETLEQLVLPLFAFVTIVRFRKEENLKALASRHEKLLRVLKQGDPMAITNAVRTHLSAHYDGF
jgi:DNA-binding FadR family transcriptional regulator